MAEVDDVAREAEARWQSLVEQVPAVVYTCDFDEAAAFRYLSPHIEELTGHPPEAFLEDWSLWYSLIHPDDVGWVREEEVRAFHTQGGFDHEYRLIHRDGTIRHVWERDQIVRDVDGRPLLSQGVLIDVTTLRRTEAALRAERDRAQLYLDTVGVIVLALDRDGKLTKLNRAGCELLGRSEEELIGLDWFDECVPEDARDVQRASFEGQIRAPHTVAPVEGVVLRRDGARRDIVWTMEVLFEGDDPAGMLVSGLDITERRRAEEEVTYLAYHDPLTGLPNRTMLQEHLELALARARRGRLSVALLFLDLDDFKLVNDGLGHAAGDELLSQVAARLGRHVRDSDTLARQGGDEFLLLIPDIERDARQRAVGAAERIVEAIREPFRLGGAEFEIGASVGISLFPADAKDADSLLEHADAAMYDAKGDATSGVRVYMPAPRAAHGVERLSFSRRLRRAIEGDELALHWQPILTLRKGKVLGFEALVRWQDPREGLRTAGDFIPVAERCGMLDLLDDWVIAAVAAQRRAWREQGFEVSVGVNVSPAQLRAERLRPMLDGLRAGGGLESVTIEIVESVPAHDDAKVRGVMRTLREAGVNIAIDDFGVAYSSLSRLNELTTRWIKVDRSFLTGVPGDEAAGALLRSVLGLLDALGMAVVVEGVESEAQLEHLRSLGVKAAQGFHLAPPMPAEELGPLIEAQAHWRLQGPPGA